MKILLITLSFILMFTLASNSKDTNKSSKTQEPIIIDVRTDAEFKMANIQGALNIPYDVIDKKIEEVTKNKDAKIILYCRSGRRSGIAEQVLKNMGYKNVENYGSLQSAKDRLGIK